MKKFSFSLDKVLNYKEQVEESLRNEHAQILRNILLKEEEIEGMEAEFRAWSDECRQRELQGATIVEIRLYESYLNNLSHRIDQERDFLERLRVFEERKRQELVEAKKETASIDLLKTKRRAEYEKELIKEQEQIIEEYVSNGRAVKKALGVLT
jgi:flagellar FliJ protein